MAAPPSKEKKIKRLQKQIKKHSSNPKMVERFESRIKTLEPKSKKK